MTGDVDEIELEQVIAGQIPAVRTTPATRRAAVRHLTERGWSASAIGARLRLSPRAVVRWRTAGREAS